MRPERSSLTAMSTAAVRALEMEGSPEERICSDSLARQFLPGWYCSFMKRLTATRYAQQHAAGDLGFIVARCRYMDDLLSDELDQGIQQLAILGAGYDSRAYRIDRLKDKVKVFEVDHPATQKNKLAKLKNILGQDGLPNNVTFVSVDFTRETLGTCLPVHGYSEQLKTLFIWEGVTMYLDLPSVDDTLAFIAHHSAPGSLIVFDYMCKKPVLQQDAAFLFVSFLRKFSKEERNFQIEAGQIEPFLASRGFHKVHNVTGEDLHARYFVGRNAERKVTSDYAIAVGRV